MTELTNNSKENITLLKELVYKMMGKNLVADLTIVQGILEAGLRNSPPSKLALLYNNLFGIKGHGTGKVIRGQLKTQAMLPTKEYSDETGWETVLQGFAVNASVEDSITQHLNLFKSGTKSKPDRYKNLFGAKTFEEIAKLVKEDGYATDPKYPEKLISVYKEFIK